MPLCPHIQRPGPRQALVRPEVEFARSLIRVLAESPAARSLRQVRA